MSILLLAAVLHLGDLPTWTYPDTEVTTNVVYDFTSRSASELRFSIAAEASPSNAFTIAFGCDADDDGVLSLDESDFTAGWDCGVWTTSGILPCRPAEFPEPTITTNEVQRWDWRTRLHGEHPDWNMFRVTVRGVSATNAWFSAGTYAEGLHFILK